MTRTTKTQFDDIAGKARACVLCADHLPFEPRPVFQIGRDAKILIAGQAPGRRVHETGIPCNDAIELTLVIGQYALDWHLKTTQKASLTQTVQDWKQYWPAQLPLPHPSPRNNIWLKKNPWFESEILPKLRHKIGSLLNG